MIWIGLHGIMFLFLFSDFYKQSYNKKQQRLKKDQEDEMTNGEVKLNNNNNNTGACMVSSQIYI